MTSVSGGGGDASPSAHPFVAFPPLLERVVPFLSLRDALALRATNLNARSILDTMGPTTLLLGSKTVLSSAGPCRAVVVRWGAHISTLVVRVCVEAFGMVVGFDCRGASAGYGFNETLTLSPSYSCTARPSLTAPLYRSSSVRLAASAS